VTSPSTGTAFWRGLRLRCAWCGSRRTFIRRWLGKYERCRTCGLRWRREEGFELGPIALNTVFTFATLAIGMLIGFVATYPDVAVGPMIGILVVVAVLMPIVIYPLTFTIWFAFDVVTHPPSEEELAQAAAALLASNDCSELH
jgi:uncharacterized protein (DUF983 family)